MVPGFQRERNDNNLCSTALVMSEGMYVSGYMYIYIYMPGYVKNIVRACSM